MAGSCPGNILAEPEPAHHTETRGPDEFARAPEQGRLGPNFPGRDERGRLARLVAFVAREMGPDGRHAEAIAEGRRPRW